MRGNNSRITYWAGDAGGRSKVSATLTRSLEATNGIVAMNSGRFVWNGRVLLWFHRADEWLFRGDSDVSRCHGNDVSNCT